MTNFEILVKDLETAIQNSYEQGTSLEDAEKLAAKFLYAQLAVSGELKKAALDAKMKKTGTKAVKAAIYMESATKDSKKPSDVMLQAIVDLNELVQGEQSALDIAEVNMEELQRYYDVFLNGHIFFRGLAKGTFGG